jgi:hypothetical protein
MNILLTHAYILSGTNFINLFLGIMKVNRFLALLMFAFFILATSGHAVLLVYADEHNPNVYSVYSKPFGKTYGEWANKWWQWFSAIPRNMNPGVDLTGKDCNVNQNDKDVWFLTLNFGTGNHVTRSCSIPGGKAIFVPIFANDCDFSDPHHPGIDGLLQCARDFTNTLRDMSLTIDGKPIVSPQSYRTDSPLFNVTYAGPTNKDNVYAVPPGTYPGRINGYFVILHPLPAGKHNILIHALAVEAPNLPQASPVVHDITYNLTVKPLTSQTRG